MNLKNNAKSKHQAKVERDIIYSVIVNDHKKNPEEYLLYFKNHKPYSYEYNIKERCKV